MFFRKKNRNQLILLLEIQSSQVRGSLILYPENSASAPYIFFSERIFTTYRPSAPSSYYLKATFDNLRTMADMGLRAHRELVQSGAHPELPHEVTEVQYVLSSPWVASQARTVSVSFEKDTIMKHDRVTRILDDERAKIKIGEEDTTVGIEEKIFDVRVNGYSISDWVGKSARTTEISYAVSVSGRDTIRHLTELVDHIVGKKNVHFHSSLLLQYVAMRDNVVPDKHSYVLIHVHGEITDVVVVRDHNCSFFGSYPIGVNTIVRMIADRAQTDPRTADSLLSLYVGDKLHDEHAADTKKIMNDVSSRWTQALGELLAQSGAQSGLPQQVYVIGHSHSQFFVMSYRSVEPHATVEPLDVEMVKVYAGVISCKKCLEE